MKRILFLIFFSIVLQYAYSRGQGNMQIRNVSTYTVPGGLFSSANQGVVLIGISGTSGNSYNDTPVAFNVDGNEWDVVISGGGNLTTSTGSHYTFSGDGSSHNVSVNIMQCCNYNFVVKTYLGYTTVVMLEY